MLKEYLPIVASSKQEDIFIRAIDATFPDADIPIPTEDVVAASLFLVGTPIDVILGVYIPEFITWKNRNSKPETPRTTAPPPTKKRVNGQIPHPTAGIPKLDIILGASCRPENRIYGGDEYAPTTPHCSVEPESPM